MSTSAAYPIGHFERPASVSPGQLAQWVDDIARLPVDLRAAVNALPSAEAIDHPYREAGWTGRQVIHHIADSHLNCYIRYRLALTEDNPTIKPYDEAAWALLPDAATAPIELSLALIDNLHARWARLLRALTPQQWKRTFVHPVNGQWALDEIAGFYGWHGRHHVAHVQSLAAGSSSGQ